MWLALEWMASPCQAKSSPHAVEGLRYVVKNKLLEHASWGRLLRFGLTRPMLEDVAPLDPYVGPLWAIPLHVCLNVGRAINPDAVVQNVRSNAQQEIRRRDLLRHSLAVLSAQRLKLLSPEFLKQHMLSRIESSLLLRRLNPHFFDMYSAFHCSAVIGLPNAIEEMASVSVQ